MRSIKSILLLLALAAICTAEEIDQDGLRQLDQLNCGVFKDVTAEGDEVIPGSRPWMAVIKTNVTRTSPYSCMGTLITDQFVLTAAHCVYGFEIQSVRLGEHRLTKDEDCIKAKKNQCLPAIESYGVERVIIHEEFKGHGHHLTDIALVKLNRKVDFKEHISPICLPVNAALQQQAESLQTLLLTSWGYDTSGEDNQVLREITVDNKNENREKCSSFLNAPNSVLICAYKNDVLCNGISGSPLSSPVEYSGRKRFVQFAVVNVGTGCSPVMGINVASFMPWITKMLAQPRPL